MSHTVKLKWWSQQLQVNSHVHTRTLILPHVTRTIHHQISSHLRWNKQLFRPNERQRSSAVIYSCMQTSLLLWTEHQPEKWAVTMKVSLNMVFGFGLENSLTLTKKCVHVVLKGLQVLFRGQFENFLRLSWTCWKHKKMEMLVQHSSPTRSFNQHDWASSRKTWIKSSVSSKSMSGWEKTMTHND